MTRAGGISGNRLPPRRYGSVETPDVPRDAAAFVARRAPKSCSGCTPEQHAAQGTFAAGIETSCTGVRRRRGRTAAGSREGPLPALRASVTGRHLRAGGDASPPRLRAQRAARARPLRCVAGVEAEGPDSDSNLIEPANVPLAWMPVTVRHQVSHVFGALVAVSVSPATLLWSRSESLPPPSRHWPNGRRGASTTVSSPMTCARRVVPLRCN